LVEDWFHQRRVEGMTHPQPYGPAPALREGVRDGEYGVPYAGNHHGTRPVHGGDRDPVREAESRQYRDDLVLGRVQRDHQPVRRQGLHQSAASGDEGGGVGQVQYPGYVGRRQFPDGVSGQEVGPYAP
jgi:hypothetical protein